MRCDGQIGELDAPRRLQESLRISAATVAIQWQIARIASVATRDGTLTNGCCRCCQSAVIQSDPVVEVEFDRERERPPRQNSGPHRALDSTENVHTESLDWRGGRAVDCTGLENRSGRKPTQGSNPCLSAHDARGQPNGLAPFMLRESPDCRFWFAAWHRAFIIVGVHARRAIDRGG